MLRLGIQNFNFDEKAFVEELKKRVNKLGDSTIRAFVRGAFPRVPQWAGASAASIIPFAELINITDLHVKPKALPGIDYDPNSPYHGVGRGLLLQESIRVPAGDKYILSFATRVPQFVLQDNDWKAFQIGERNADVVSQKFKTVVPDWGKFLRFSR